MHEWILLIPPARFEPLSDLVISILPLRPSNLLKLMMNESVLREDITSMCMGLLERQLYRGPYRLTSFRQSLHKKWTKQVHPIACKCWFLIHSLLEKMDHFPVAAAFLSTACTWHTSRWYIWPKSHILSPKSREPDLGHCHASTSMSCLFMTPTCYELSSSAGFWQQHWLLHLIFQCCTLNTFSNS